MDRMSLNFIYAFILARSRLGLLPIIFHKFVTSYGPWLMFLWHEKYYSRILLQFKLALSFGVFSLIWFLTSQSTIFSYVETGLPLLNQDKAWIYCVMLEDTTQCHRWGLNLHPLYLVPSTLPLSSLFWEVTSCCGSSSGHVFLEGGTRFIQASLCKFKNFSRTFKTFLLFSRSEIYIKYWFTH